MKRGRPKKKAADKHTSRLEILVTSAERRAFDRAAKQAGLSLSAWLRDVARKAAS